MRQRLMHKDVKEILVTKDDIEKRSLELAKEIDNYYREKKMIK